MLAGTVRRNLGVGAGDGVIGFGAVRFFFGGVREGPIGRPSFSRRSRRIIRRILLLGLRGHRQNSPCAFMTTEPVQQLQRAVHL